MKRCRCCNAVIDPGERFCSPQCRLEALGRENIHVKKDAEHGWNYVTKQITGRKSA